MATIRQRKLAYFLSDSIRKRGDKSLGQLMRATGYARSTSLRPSQVTRSKGFAEVMDKGGITDAMLVKCLMDGFNAVKSVGGIEIKDFAVIHKYLTTLLKIKGLFGNKRRNGQSTKIYLVKGGPTAQRAW